MTAQLLIATFFTVVVTATLTLGSTAFAAYLIVDSAFLEPLRDRLFTYLRAPAQRYYDAAIDEYRTNLNNALNRGEDIPTNTPQPPADPFLVMLLSCRWCTGAWLALLFVVIARLALTAPLGVENWLLLWPGAPLTVLDFALIPAWWFTTSYANGFLSNHEE